MEERQPLIMSNIKMNQITVGKVHANTRKLNRNILKVTAVFLNQKRMNVCEHTTQMASLESFKKVPPGGCKECDLKLGTSDHKVKTWTLPHWGKVFLITIHESLDSGGSI